MEFKIFVKRLKEQLPSFNNESNKLNNILKSNTCFDDIFQ